MTTYTVTKHHATSRSDFTSESACEAFEFYCRGTVQWVSFVEVKIDGEAASADALQDACIRERRGNQESPL